jgi:hypothetical protein
MFLKRRSVLFGFGAALLAAPAIVRVSSIMPVSVLHEDGFFTVDFGGAGFTVRNVSAWYFADDGVPFTIEDGSRPWTPPKAPDESTPIPSAPA